MTAINFPQAYQDAAAVTPHDTTPLAKGTCKGLYIGGTGAVSVITQEGNTVTFAAVPVGIFPIACTHVRSTSTAATNIVALY